MRGVVALQTAPQSTLSTSATSRHRDMERLWRKIDENFESVACFLMPHPGNQVATSEKYYGPLKHVDATFVDQLKTFIPRLLSADFLEPRYDVTPADLFSNVSIYTNLIQTSGLPKVPESLMTSAAHLHYWSIYDGARTNYDDEMDRFIESSTKKAQNSTQQPISLEALRRQHNRLKAVSLQMLEK